MCQLLRFVLASLKYNFFFSLQKTQSTAKERAIVPKVGWVKLVINLVFMVQQPLILSVNVNLVTMAHIVIHFVPTKAVPASMVNAIVDLRDGEENFVKRGDVQG